MLERFTDRANRVMEYALREALQLGHGWVAPEHILLGLVREGESTAAQVLVLDLGVELSAVRKAVINRLSGHVPPEHAYVATCPHGIDVAFHAADDTPHALKSAREWLGRGMTVTLKTENVTAQLCQECRRG